MQLRLSELPGTMQKVRIIEVALHIHDRWLSILFHELMLFIWSAIQCSGFNNLDFQIRIECLEK